MAYSDYGGMAYKDEVKRPDFCDVVIYKEASPDEKARYPFFFGENRDEKFSRAHVSLGDMEARVVLYKQSWFEIWFDGKQLDPCDVLSKESKEEVPEYQTSYKNDDTGKPYFSTDAFMNEDKVAVFEFNGFKLFMFWEVTSNHYQYGKLIQPDGSVWKGFSGYGIGNGLEEAGYGYSTDAIEKRLHEVFPKE